MRSYEGKSPAGRLRKSSMGHRLPHPLGQSHSMHTRRFPSCGPTAIYRLTVAPPLTVEFRSITYHIEFCDEEPSSRHELIAREGQRCSHWKHSAPSMTALQKARRGTCSEMEADPSR